MRILIDSREQLPFSFEKYDGVTTQVVALPVGDYSLAGFQDRIGIERKSLNDLVMCLMGKARVRFEKELGRGRHYDVFMVEVKASLADVSQGRYRSEMKPQAVLQSIITSQVRHRTAFVWAGNRAGAEHMAYSLLAKYLREITERFKLATKAQG